MDYSTRNIIDFAYDDNGKEMRDALYAQIHARVMAHLEDKKKEIASTLITQEEIEPDDEYETNEDNYDEPYGEEIEEGATKEDY
jgi:hypothetical protein